MAALVWLVIAWSTARSADVGDVGPAGLLAGCMATIGLGLLVATVAHLYVDLPRLVRAGPWLITLALLLGLWEVVTAKLDLLPRPFFATPQSLLEVYEDDWVRLGEYTLRSVMLLVAGYAIGATLGFVTGVAIGWSRGIGYWGHPVLRFIVRHQKRCEAPALPKRDQLRLHGETTSRRPCVSLGGCLC